MVRRCHINLHKKTKMHKVCPTSDTPLPGLNPGHPRDGREYSPIYYNDRTLNKCWTLSDYIYDKCTLDYVH